MRKLFEWLVIFGAAGFAYVYVQRARVDAGETTENDVTAALERMHARPKPAPPPRVSSVPATRILFIGNSLTFSAGMPNHVVQLARAAGIDVDAEVHAPGGAWLKQQQNNPNVQRLLAQGGWDFIVLQEQSQVPSFPDAQVRAEMDPALINLAMRARRDSPSGKVVLYLTPAKENGDAQNAAIDPGVATYDGMQQRIVATYHRLGSAVGATVVPAGEAWMRVRHEHPEISLYADGTHPNQNGAYLIACSFFATLLDRSPVGNSYHGDVGADVAEVLQRAAWSVK